MLPLLLDTARPLKILCLGAHCDDIEIGCGGTILRLVDTIPDLEIRWVVFTGSSIRQGEARRAARAILGERHRIDLHGFRESFLPQQWGAVKEQFERIKTEFQPSLVFTHMKDDAHQDHRVVSELTWNTFRDHTIVEYEIPKYEGDLGNPNLFIPLSPALAERKVEIVTGCFASQQARAWFSPDTFLATLRLRGVGCNATYAEAFHARKLVI